MLHDSVSCQDACEERLVRIHGRPHITVILNRLILSGVRLNNNAGCGQCYRQQSKPFLVVCFNEALSKLMLQLGNADLIQIGSRKERSSSLRGVGRSQIDRS